MPEVRSNEPCLVCGKCFATMHSHHTTPQSRGGRDSPQVILCATCHNVVHSQALYVYNRIRKPKENSPSKIFWEDPVLEQRASKLVQLIVQAFGEPCDNSRHILSVEVDGQTLQDFKKLAADLGASQEHALLYCIHKALKDKGITDGTKTKGSNNMWFMRSPSR